MQVQRKQERIPATHPADPSLSSGLQPTEACRLLEHSNPDNGAFAKQSSKSGQITLLLLFGFELKTASMGISGVDIFLTVKNFDNLIEVV